MAAPPSSVRTPFSVALVADTPVAFPVVTTGGVALIVSLRIRALLDVSSKLPSSDPSAYSKTKLIDRIEARVGVPDITPVDGFTDSPSGKPNAAYPVGLPVATML